jgi:hypothetical protein
MIARVLMREAPAAPASRPRRRLRLAGFILGVVVTLLVVGMISFLRSLPTFDGNVGRQHLQSIPIDRAACPSVRGIHAAAGDLQASLPFFGSVFDEHGKLMPWGTAQTRIRRSGLALEREIEMGLPTFPWRVRSYLLQVLDGLKAGRVYLEEATDPSDFSRRTERVYTDGKEALGYAGDLVGNQCGVPLAV